jgi:hypothetical protein
VYPISISVSTTLDFPFYFCRMHSPTSTLLFPSRASSMRARASSIYLQTVQMAGLSLRTSQTCMYPYVQVLYVYCTKHEKTPGTVRMMVTPRGASSSSCQGASLELEEHTGTGHGSCHVERVPGAGPGSDLHPSIHLVPLDHAW